MHKLFTRYLNSTSVFSPPDDDAAAVRASIKVDVGAKSDAEIEAEKNEPDDEAVNEETEADVEENEDADEEVDEEKKDEDEDETDETKAAKLVQEKEERKQARIQRRIDKAVAEAKAAKAENEELRRQLAAKPVDGLTEEEVQRRAEEIASAKLAEKQSEIVKKQFDKDCEVLRDQAIKLDKNFDTKIGEAVEELGKPIPSKMIGILADLDNGNGGEVLNYLADNIDDAEEIWDLPEGRMTAKLIRISDKLKAAQKPEPKPKSKVPPPVSDVTEGNRPISPGLPKKPTENIEDWVRIRNKQEAEYRKSKGLA